MNFQIRLFAGLAEQMGTSCLAVETPSECLTASLLKEELVRLYPAQEPLLAQAMIAVNQQFAAAHQPISSSDEIALIPPVSGG